MKQFPVSKSGLFATIPLIITAHLVWVSSATAATDFVSMQNDIQDTKANIEVLESSEGRYSFQLLEPLEQLARI